MKSLQAQSKNRKQKNELIFQYLKSLTPFQSNAISNDILLKLKSGKHDYNSNKQLITNSNNAELIVAMNAVKDKKKVRFLDQVSINEKKDNTKRSQRVTKKKFEQIKTLRQKNTQNNVSPQQILKSVSELKASVYNSFKIIQDSNNQLQQTYRIYDDNQYKKSQTKIQILPPKSARTLKDGTTQTVSRVKSDLFLTKSSQNTIKQSPKIFNKLFSSDISTNRNSQYSLSHSNYWSGGLAQQNVNHRQRTNSKSKILSKHENNLMIQIFKQRLSTKIIIK